MKTSIFVREYNTQNYDQLAQQEFSVLPRIDEFISISSKGKKAFYQVIAIHHPTEAASSIELYAVQTEPTWELKKPGSIGFSF
jgi:hypothetical protein